MAKHFLFFFFVLTGGFIFAQQGTLKGTIVDDAAKEGLPGATIQLLGDLSKGTAADVEGNYSL